MGKSSSVVESLPAVNCNSIDLKRDPDVSEETLVACGKEKANAGKFKESVDFYTAALNTNDDMNARYARGESLRRWGRLEEASADLSAVLESIHANVMTKRDAAYSLGDVALAQGNPSQALEFAKRASVLDPNFVDAYNLAGLAKLKTKDCPSLSLQCSNEAVRYFQTALNIDPENSIAENGMKGALDLRKVAISDKIKIAKDLATSISDYRNAEAVAGLTGVLDVDPTNAEAWYLLATAYGELADEWDCDYVRETCGKPATPRALAAIDMAIEFDPNNETYKKLRDELKEEGFFDFMHDN